MGLVRAHATRNWSHGGIQRTALRQARCHMIECAAERVAQVCLADPRVTEVRVRVEKSGVVPGLRAAAVEIVRGRDGASA